MLAAAESALFVVGTGRSTTVARRAGVLESAQVTRPVTVPVAVGFCADAIKQETAIATGIKPDFRITKL